MEKINRIKENRKDIVMERAKNYANKNKFMFVFAKFFAIAMIGVLFLSLIPITDAELTITTDKKQYFQEETVVLTANLGEKGNITFQVKNPENKTIFTYTKETTNGKADVSFKLRDNAKIGNYIVFASSNVNGETYKSETTFIVKEKTKEEPPIITIYIIVIAVIIGTAVIIIAYVIRELAKFSLLQFLSPLWALMNKDKIRDNATRMEILGYVKGNPGAHLNEIINVLNHGNGEVNYHLHELEKEGLIESKNDGLRRRFYPKNIVLADPKSSLSKIQREIVRIVKKFQGIPQYEIARKLEKSEQVIDYHIELLYRHSILRVERSGRTMKCYLGTIAVDLTWVSEPSHLCDGILFI